MTDDLAQAIRDALGPRHKGKNLMYAERVNNSAHDALAALVTQAERAERAETALREVKRQLGLYDLSGNDDSGMGLLAEETLEGIRAALAPFNTHQNT